MQFCNIVPPILPSFIFIIMILIMIMIIIITKTTTTSTTTTTATNTTASAVTMCSDRDLYFLVFIKLLIRFVTHKSPLTMSLDFVVISIQTLSPGCCD